MKENLEILNRFESSFFDNNIIPWNVLIESVTNELVRIGANPVGIDQQSQHFKSGLDEKPWWELYKPPSDDMWIQYYDPSELQKFRGYNDLILSTKLAESIFGGQGPPYGKPWKTHF